VSLSDKRHALTILELLVVISIIGMLMALLLPAVVASREQARLTHCGNNLRNLGLAMMGEATARGRFPGAGYFSAGPVQDRHNWVVSLLPRIERRDLYSLWNFDKLYEDPGNRAVSGTQVNLLICPDDDSVVPGQGNLSYVVNLGVGWTVPSDCPVTWRSILSPTPGIQAFDLNGNGVVCPAKEADDGAPSDREYYYRLGLFFLENWPMSFGSHRHHSLDSVRDGLSRTIMLSENVRPGYDAASGATWASPRPLNSAFILSGYICASAKCAAGNVDFTKANGHSAGPWDYEAINSGLEEKEGEAPWPNSFHPGGVNVLYADGHLRFLSQDVDGRVYAAAVSPLGVEIMGPLAQPPMDD
jgi:prepilin-type processing-associated H-X9-DG protein